MHNKWYPHPHQLMHVLWMLLQHSGHWETSKAHAFHPSISEHTQFHFMCPMSAENSTYFLGCIWWRTVVIYKPLLLELQRRGDSRVVLQTVQKLETLASQENKEMLNGSWELAHQRYYSTGFSKGFGAGYCNRCTELNGDLFEKWAYLWNGVKLQK